MPLVLVDHHEQDAHPEEEEGAHPAADDHDVAVEVAAATHRKYHSSCHGSNLYSHPLSAPSPGVRDVGDALLCLHAVTKTSPPRSEVAERLGWSLVTGHYTAGAGIRTAPQRPVSPCSRQLSLLLRCRHHHPSSPPLPRPLPQELVLMVFLRQLNKDFYRKFPSKNISWNRNNVTKGAQRPN